VITLSGALLIYFEAAKILKINEKNVGVVKSEGEIEAYRTGKVELKRSVEQTNDANLKKKNI
jgi:hypothetical protein